MEDQTMLSMKDISKYFPGVRALSGVNFSLRSGEIHALMGQNGAGKSTLIKILTGVYKPDTGTIVLKGKPVQVESPEHAQALGIATVYQEVNLCPNLSVAENLLLGREPRKVWGISWKTMLSEAKKNIREKLDLDIDPARPLGSYSLAIQQMVAIARSLCVRSDILILDEPTSSLDEAEVERLFLILRKLKQEGLAILFVTHFLDQVYAVSDRITVLRNGEFVGTTVASELSKINLISQMVGKDPAELVANVVNREKRSSGTEQEILNIHGLGKTGYLKPFDLSLHRGEIVGLAGLLGSGRTETAKLLFAAERATEGTVYKDQREVHLASPRDAIMEGMGFCPEDRKTEGLVGDLSVRENIILALQAKQGILRYLSRKDQEEIAQNFIKVLDIKTPNAERPVKTLSGGNQQKVLLARWLATKPSILILDEPTRGIDVGAKAEILQRIQQLRNEGISIVFISSELEEVVATSDRIVVFRDKKKVAEAEGSDIEEPTIMRLIAQEDA
jgi:simple sugar transport system ATP-binding protein